MISTAAFRRAWLTALLLACGAVWAGAQPPAGDATLFRVFLNDGSTLVSYGEFSRVGDQVIVPLPIQLNPLKLQMISIPGNRVDWDRTDAYSDSARAARYAATRGPDDFAMLSTSVSQALTDIALTEDPQRKAAMAAEARQNLTKWLAEHFGYRATDVAQMAGWFDEIVARSRQAAGQPNFDLSLMAANAAPPSVPLLPPPGEAAMLQQSLAAATLVESAADRISLLRAIRDSLQGQTDPSLIPLKATVANRLADEERTTSTYATYVRQVLRAAARLAAKADVQGLIDMAAHILDDDDEMGHKRPGEVASLLSAVDAKLEAARELRLARDQWEARRQLRYAYYHAIEEPERALRLSRPALSEIQKLAGPAPSALGRAKTRLTLAKSTLDVVKAPPQMETAHALLTGALRLALQAVESRFAAIQGAGMQRARDASSAAAGALLLLDRATEELKRAEELPQPK